MKKVFLLTTAALLASGGFAASLTPAEALQRISSSAEGKRMLKSASEPRLAYTAKDKKGEAAVYVFNRTDGGFMLLSGDDLAMPMLGYTDSGSFDPANIPPQLKYWIEEYAGQIEYAKDNQSEFEPVLKNVGMTFPSTWKSVTPLLTTNWNQGAPYDMYTPVIGGAQAPTGCVATAMAQVMNYWEYPKTTGTGQVSYSCPGVGTLTMIFDRQDPFDWDNMLDNYISGQYNETQGKAVANLMKQCGYASQMKYMAYTSGTQTELVGKALMEYFGYSKGISMEQRLGYTASDWNALCYSQLAIGPVIYAGASPDGAHCFVLDGYDGDGYFHINWGWGGICNGYYLLNALNPTQQGTGGFYGGYNFTQGIVAGVQPEGTQTADNELTLSLYGTVTATASSSYLTFSYSNGKADPRLGNDCMESIRPQLGMEITRADGTGEPVYVAGLGFSNVFPPGSYTLLGSTTSRIQFDRTLPDGRYMARIVCRNANNSNDTWHHLVIDPQNYDYVYVTKSGTSLSVENLTVKKYQMTGAQITSPLYYDNPFLIELTIENPYDVEITQSVMPYLYKGGVPNYTGENRLITLMPNEKTTVTFSCTMKELQGATVPTTTSPADFNLVIINPSTDEEYGNFGTVTMKRSTSNASLNGRSMSITNAAESGFNEEIGYLYSLNDFRNIDVEVTVAASNGFISSPITAIITEYDPETKTSGIQVLEKDFEDMVYLEKGETATLHTVLHFNDYDPSKIYQIAAYYLKSNRRSLLAAVRCAASSGVEEIATEAGSLTMEYANGSVYAASPYGIMTIEAFDSKGSRIAVTAIDTLDLGSLSSGLYIVRAVDSNGSTRTIKVVK